MKLYERICDSVCHAICHGTYDIVHGQAQPLYDNAFRIYLHNGTIIRVFFYENAEIMIFNTTSGRTFKTFFTLGDTIDNIAARIITNISLNV